MNAVMPDCECVHHALSKTMPMPLVITEYSTQTSGTTATNTDSVTRTVAALLVSLRRRLTDWNVGALTGLSSVEVIGLPFRPPRREPPS